MAKARWSNTKKKTFASLITLAVLIVLYTVLRLLIVNGVISNYYTGIINLACVNIVAAVSLNLVTGVLGQLVLGHAGFMLVGAYGTAIFLNTANDTLGLELSLILGLLIGGLLSAVIGLIIGLPALRLRGDYLAIMTLGFGEIIRVIANNLSITNGAKGLSGFPRFPRDNPAGLFTFAFVMAVLVIFFSYTFGTSRYGRSVLAIREDEIAAESSGINTVYYKLLTFTISAFFAGVAGGLYAMYNGIINPSNFDFNRSVEVLMMVVLGGMGSITGSVISATVITALPEVLRSFADYRMVVYSLVLIVVMLFRPTGLLGRKEIALIKPFEKLRTWLAGKGSSKKGGAA